MRLSRATPSSETPKRRQPLIPTPNGSSEESAADMERHLGTPGFRCIKLHPSLAGYPLDGPNYEAVWSLAQARGCPVLTHAWVGDATCGPAQVRHVLERHRAVNLIFGHALYPATFPEAAELAKSFETLRLDITTSQHAYGFIEHAVKSVGAERILFGSDMPFISAAGAVGLVLYAQISDADKARIFGGNAKRLLVE
ncbi:MAG: amidohydrolase family protein [Candidatus Hydrogenedentes bacterium]|nr:amidohydrolase family protein [Candidatus Hydrogenedentota bacterium]